MTDAPERITACAWWHGTSHFRRHDAGYTDAEFEDTKYTRSDLAKAAEDAAYQRGYAQALEDVAPVMPKVKPLVWKEYSAQGWSRGLVVGYANTPGGGRETEIKRNPHGWTYGGKCYQANVGSKQSLDDALEAAKAAAQADYEHRIYEALVETRYDQA